MLEIGSVIDGKYKILNKIGQGGMSVVYLAMNEKANKQWAIKEVRKDGIKEYEIVKQGLIVETDLLKKLNHPNLPSIIDVIDTQGTFLIVMDYIEGRPLQEYLEEMGARSQEEVIDWAKQLCDVLAYLHSREPAIIYRDLKPGNIMLKPNGSIMLIDFGTAREFKEKNIADTVCLGTIGYAAPEQFGGRVQTDARTDIYALGVTLHHLITGIGPDSPQYRPIPIRQYNQFLSSGLEKIIDKCTKYDANDRYQSCEELRYDLDNYNKIDDIYKKKQKRKLIAFTVIMLLMIISLILGIGFGKIASKKLNNNYAALLATAEKANDEDSKKGYYLDAISMKPDSKEAYIGLINAMKIDGTFSLEEDDFLKKAIDDHEMQLQKNPQEYADICFEIGKLYWYYYEYGATDDFSENKPVKMKFAAKWFDLAVNNSDSSFEHYAMAVIYRDIGIFYRDIGMNEIEVNDSGMYRELMDNYDKLVSQLEKSNEGDIVKLELYKLIQSSINNYSQQFKSDGVELEELLEMINYVKEQLNEITPANQSTEEMKNSTLSAIDNTIARLENEYSKTPR